MSLPGFTAEASLYKSTRHYLMGVSGTPVIDAGAITPATQPFICYWHCFDLGFPYGYLCRWICAYVPSS